MHLSPNLGTITEILKMQQRWLIILVDYIISWEEIQLFKISMQVFARKYTVTSLWNGAQATVKIFASLLFTKELC